MKQIFSVYLLAIVPSFSNLHAQMKRDAPPTNAAQAKVAHDAEEVYPNLIEYRTPALLALYLENESRVTIINQPALDNEQIPVLSSVGLKNKYNPLLPGDYGKNFDAGTFNPLKYMFDFYPLKESFYRVDNSNFIVVIHPKL